MKHAKKSNPKIILLLACVVVLAFGAIGGTLAWLIDETDEVVNTFTYGDINITLEETDTDNDGNNNNNTYVMMPGHKIAKDPIVTVLKNSEDNFLFVKLTKSENFDTFLTYAMADGWTVTEEKDNYIVYYREVSKADADNPIQILAGIEDTEYAKGYVSVKETVSKDDIEALKNDGATLPTLTIKAYAVQRDDNITTPGQAWELAKAQEAENAQPTP